MYGWRLGSEVLLPLMVDGFSGVLDLSRDAVTSKEYSSVTVPNSVSEPLLGYRVFFFSIRLPLSASARKMFHLEFFDSKIQEVTNKVQYSGYQRTCRNKRRFYTETAPNLKTSCTRTLFLRAAEFFSGREGDGLHGCTTTILTRIPDNKVCDSRGPMHSYPVLPAGVLVLVPESLDL